MARTHEYKENKKVVMGTSAMFSAISSVKSRQMDLAKASETFNVAKSIPSLGIKQNDQHVVT